MTTPQERTRAVLQTERFLIDLASGQFCDTLDQIKDEAKRLLRHYPSKFDMEMACLSSKATSLTPDVFGEPDGN
jgi:hypothetical protein